MNAAEQKTESIPSALKHMLENVAIVDPDEQPIQFVRGLAQLWKSRGGKFEGKTRHSVSYLRDMLEIQGTPIRSLTPKLKGTTRLQPTDAEALVRFFLSHWKYIGKPSDPPVFESTQYQPMLKENQINEISSYIKQKTFEGGTEAEDEIISAEEPPATNAVPLPGEETARLIESEFQKCDGLFTVSSGRTLISTTSPRTSAEGLASFRNLITNLWTIERNDKKGRFLVWVLDYTIFGWQAEDLGSRSRFMNVHALIQRLKALTEFPDKHANVSERWNWLQSNAVIVIYGAPLSKSGAPISKSEVIEVDPELAKIQHHQVLISAVPPNWARSPAFRALYGPEEQEASYSIFASKPAEQTLRQSNSAAELEFEFSYFAHAQLQLGGKNGTTDYARSLRLPYPGWSYELAYRFVYAAVTHVLRPDDTSKQNTKIGAQAAAGLRERGFSFLSPEQFIKL